MLRRAEPVAVMVRAALPRKSDASRSVEEHRRTYRPRRTQLIFDQDWDAEELAAGSPRRAAAG